MSNIPVYYVEQFSANIAVLSQQKGSRLEKTVTSGSYIGSQGTPVDQVGAISAIKVVNRYAPMGRVDATADRRWVFPVDYELPQLVDSFDKLRLLIDPMSTYVMNAMYAMGRAKDDEIISAYHGIAKTGNQGGTSTALPSTQIVSVSQGSATPSGLTVPKLREAKRILMTNEVDIDNDTLWVAVKAKQHDNLLAEAQVVSTDFNDKPVLVEGKVVRFLGFNFVHSERLLSGTDDAAGTSDAIPAYAQSGMHLGMWDGISSDISRRNDLSGLPYQAYCKGTFGATRLEEKKVVKIWCR
jgi:hypothetical protein